MEKESKQSQHRRQQRNRLREKTEEVASDIINTFEWMDLPSNPGAVEEDPARAIYSILEEWL